MSAPWCDARFLAVAAAVRQADGAQLSTEVVDSLCERFACSPTTIRREVKRARRDEDCDRVGRLMRCLEWRAA